MLKMDKARLISEYALRKHTTAKQLIPRVGFYKIKSFLKTTESNGRVYVEAEANWSDDKNFNISILTRVELAYLYGSNCEGQTSLHPFELLDSIIEVKSVELVSYEYDGKPKSAYKIEWDIIGFIDLMESLSPVVPPIPNPTQNNNLAALDQDNYLANEHELVEAENHHNMLQIETAFLKWFEEEGLLNEYQSLEFQNEDSQLLIDEQVKIEVESEQGQ